MEAAVAQAGEFHAFYAAVFGRLVGQLYLATGECMKPRTWSRRR
jgi:hypothetical protein